VADLEQDMQLLEELKLLPPERRQELDQALRQLVENTAATRPGKIYEGLDAVSSALHQLAETGVRQMATAARDLERLAFTADLLAAKPDEPTERALRAMAERLGKTLSQPPLSTLLANQSFSAEQCAALRDSATPLTQEQLQKLAKQLSQCRSALDQGLQQLRQFDPEAMEKLLAQLNAQATGLGPSTSTDDLTAPGTLLENGSISRGPGHAPLELTAEHPRLEQPLTPDRLTPEALRMDAAVTLGISTAEPNAEPTDDGGHGILVTDPGRGGESRQMRIPPRDRALVRKFFSDSPGETATTD